VLRYAKPYTPDIISFIGGLDSASNSYDRLGHLIRITPIINDNSLVGLPPSVSKAAFTLLHTGLLGTSNALTFNPYPKPGQIGTEAATGRSNIVGPSQMPASGYKFPHVLADC
jgi:hypothetical protein